MGNKKEKEKKKNKKREKGKGKTVKKTKKRTKKNQPGKLLETSHSCLNAGLAHSIGIEGGGACAPFMEQAVTGA